MSENKSESSNQKKYHIQLFLLLVGLFVSVETLGPFLQSCERGFNINDPLNAIPSAMFHAGILTLVFSCLHRFVFSGMIAFTLLYGGFCYANLLHYRGLDAFLPIHMLGETQQLAGLSSSIFALMKWYDIFYLIFPAILLFLLFRIKKKFTGFCFSRQFAIVGIFILVMTVPYYFANKSIGATFHRFRAQILERCQIQPINTYKTLGLVPIIYFQVNSLVGAAEYDVITDVEMQQIKGIINENLHATHLNGIAGLKPKKNLIVMLMESLNTTCISPSVMPTLDSLCSLSTSLYCPNTNQLKQGAMSIGGQLVVLSGLNGLRTAPFCTLCPYNIYPSIARDMKARCDSSVAYIIVSTDKNYWRQSEVSEALGFDKVYDKNDGADSFNKHKWADDKSMFQMALDKMPDNGRPFCAVIAPSNMHSNYNVDKTIDCNVTFDDISDEKCHEYFRRARYLDNQIAYFIKELKDRELYEETLIVVTSDHQIPWHYCSEFMCSTLSEYFPTAFINTGVCWEENRTANENMVFCHSQVYPTMLQLMGLKPTEYAGLFPPMTDIDASAEYDFDSCASDETASERLKLIYNLQEKMIRNGYFNGEAIQ